MGLTFFKNTVLLVVLTIISCGNGPLTPKGGNEGGTSTSLSDRSTSLRDQEIIVGAEQFSLYAELLKGKNVGLVANQTSFLENENQHLVDFLISKNISVRVVLYPENRNLNN